jgi:hypothetical protein
MKHKNLALIFLAVISLSACNNSNTQTENSITEDNKTMGDHSLIGKKGLITFPEMKAEVNYISDSTLHWKTTDSKGVVAEGDEKMSYEKLTDSIYFLNWIEKDGWTVSQIINTKEGKVKAYWSFNDEKSNRGKRSSMFVEAKFEFAK